MCMFVSGAVGGLVVAQPFGVVPSCVAAMVASRWTGGDKSIPN